MVSPADAVKLIQSGIAKGVTDKSNAQIRLGMALQATFVEIAPGVTVPMFKPA